MSILLVGINSTYQHTSFGLRYLKANLGSLRDQCELLEVTIQKNPRDLIETILKLKPRIVGFGVYIWNTDQVLETIMLLKRIAPEIKIVLGGPEISYETDQQEHLKWCDHVICGEADFQFRELCLELLEQTPALLSFKKIISASLPNIAEIKMPYDLYSDADIQNRTIYVEASRGCPYKCEYCLSSLDKSVRTFDQTLFLAALEDLYQRGTRIFKFIDRTFNLNPRVCLPILDLFLKYKEEDIFIHFEMVPDRLPIEIREKIQQFRAGQVQFEIGIQTLNPVVAANVSRKNDLIKVAENFEFLKSHTAVHTHADLIVGLPGETIESFGEGFDQLYKWGPDEIQVGILKRLKGTPIVRHDEKYKMVYHLKSPFMILQNAEMSFHEIQKMQAFAKFWDLYANNGIFKNFMGFLFAEEQLVEKSYFKTFFKFVEFLNTRHSQTYGIHQVNLFESAYLYCEQNFQTAKRNSDFFKHLMIEDYLTPQRPTLPNFLRIPGFDPKAYLKNMATSTESTSLMKRQSMHLN